MTAARRNPWAIAAGAIRCASGVSFLVAPAVATKIWGGDPDDNPTASLLLRSMGYRDALVGGMLLRSGLRGDANTPGWFLASGGADLADLVGDLAKHDRLPPQSRTVGTTGAVVGVLVGLAGAADARRRLARRAVG